MSLAERGRRKQVRPGRSLILAPDARSSVACADGRGIDEIGETGRTDSERRGGAGSQPRKLPRRGRDGLVRARGRSLPSGRGPPGGAPAVARSARPRPRRLRQASAALWGRPTSIACGLPPAVPSERGAQSVEPSEALRLPESARRSRRRAEGDRLRAVEDSRRKSGHRDDSRGASSGTTEPAEADVDRPPGAGGRASPRGGEHSSDRLDPRALPVAGSGGPQGGTCQGWGRDLGSGKSGRWGG